jgi:hypothetical protein
MKLLTKNLNMNRIFVLSAIGASALLVQNTEASLLFSDGFNYTSGDNLGAGSTTPPWTATATPASNLSIGSTDLTYAGAPDPGGNGLVMTQSATSGLPVYAALNSSITSGSVYYSFLIDCTTAPTTASYLTSLTSSVHPGANGVTSDALAVYGNKATGGTTWELGIRIDGSSAAYDPTALTVGDTYLAVVEYTFNGTTPSASLFIDPTAGGTQPAAVVTLNGIQAAANPDISDVSFKAQTSADGNYIFGNLNVGTTFADVNPASAVPEPASLALIGLGAASLGLMRRFRR